FNTTHPDVQVVRSQKSWNMIREVLYTNFSAGKGPDVMTGHANYAAEFGESGYFKPIDEYADFEEVKSWFLPNIMESTKYKGRYYGVPFNALAFVLVLNKDLFDAEGLSPPRTWSEFRDAARRLTKDLDGDGSIDQWGLVLLGGDKAAFSYRMAPFIYKAGGDILSDDLKTAVFDSPEAVSAVRLFADMYQVDRSITPGFLAYTLSEMNDLFCSNRVAMSIEGPWLRSMVDEKSPGKQFYTVPVPVPDHLIHTYETAPTLQDMVMFSINSKSPHPEAAWEFIKFVRSEDADMSWATRSLGGLPTTLAALNSPAAVENIDGFSVLFHELQNARPWPPHPKIIPIALNVLAPYGQKAIVGDLTPEEAMHRAVKEANDLLGGE
ncbi:MAG TPA: ABC transporter substrate-binding protein, partial [Rhodothermales bacterium]|nr:ABC transporter substrate-binding protein [Rhodothermales bacterium]